VIHAGRGTGIDFVDSDVAIAAITAAELLVGVELTKSETRASWVEAFFDSVAIERYDLAVARSHARLFAHARRTGRPRQAHDLIVAATASTHGRTVITLDPRVFEDLPGVVVRPA
jgi:tRNA(fMet)-specific endonuclease VapC